MPSDILAKTCFATTRYDDPLEGFQRMLDKKRALEIAKYIDEGLGTIPNSIVLSAQPDAELQIVGRGKTVEFKVTPKSFLILDGQHSVYGFALAKTALRVPVVIYNGLSRRDETRLFIDINTKQRPVPNELLLDIKKLADYETDTEQKLRELFDMFNSSPESPLVGLMNPAARESKKISRVTFNRSMKPLVTALKDYETDRIYTAVSYYLKAFLIGMSQSNSEVYLTNPKVFNAIMLLFQEIAQRVKDRHGAEYSQDNFSEVMEPMFTRLKKSTYKRSGGSAKELKEEFLDALKIDFSL
jgi:DGQHR domain-containing protein